jgi:hypothetical protein
VSITVRCPVDIIYVQPSFIKIHRESFVDAEWEITFVNTVNICFPNKIALNCHVPMSILLLSFYLLGMLY